MKSTGAFLFPVGGMRRHDFVLLRQGTCSGRRRRVWRLSEQGAQAAAVRRRFGTGSENFHAAALYGWGLFRLLCRTGLEAVRPKEGTHIHAGYSKTADRVDSVLGN